MENNVAEQTIRPFTIVRKHFFLIESSNRAKASAVIYILVEYVNANQINTCKYFELILTEISKHVDDTNLSFIDDLLPWAPKVQAECPSMYKKS